MKRYLMVAMLVSVVPNMSSAETMTRSQAVDRALASSTELAHMRTTGELARRLGKIGPYPANPIVAAEIEGAPSPLSSREYTRRLTLEQEIDLRGERRARRQVGQATVALVDQELTAREQGIIAAVDEVVGRWLVARRRLALLQPLLGQAKAMQSSAEAARRRETVTSFAARLLRSEAVALEAEAADAKREGDQAGAELRVWLGLAPSDSVEFVDDLEDSSWNCRPEAVLAMAQASRGDWARAMAAESLAVSRLELERRLGRINPTIGISAARERLFVDSAPLTGGGFVGPIKDSDTVLGIRASIPLPLAQRNQVAIAEAAVDLQRAHAERAGVGVTIAQDAGTACAALMRGEERRALLRGVAESATSDLQLTEEAYRGGRIPLEDYLTLRDRLVRVQRDYLEATAAVEEGRARLVRATGIRRDSLTNLLRNQPR